VAVLDSGHLPHRLIEQARHAIVGVSFAHRLRRCRRAANRGSSPAVHRRLALCRARKQNTRQLFTAISDVGVSASGKRSRRDRLRPIAEKCRGDVVDVKALSELGRHSDDWGCDGGGVLSAMPERVAAS
jgi:hypothetical protein